MEVYELIKNAILALDLEKDPCYRVTCKEDGTGDDLYESIAVHINGQLYLLFDYNHKGISFHIISEKEEYPAFSGNVQNGDSIQIYHNGRMIKNCRNACPVDEIINMIFGDYEKAKFQRGVIANAIKNILGKDVPIESIGYDLCDHKYYIRDWNKNVGVESDLIKAFFEEKKNEVLYEKKVNDGFYKLYKYTSLNTLLKMLQSQKIRMYSLPAMNDRKEVGFLTSNEQKIADKEEDWIFHSVMKEANKRYITSFSVLEDNLTMWRLYGDDAKGVCLEFMAEYDTPNLYPVHYEEDNGVQNRVAQLKAELASSNLQFKFLSLERKWQYYMKPACFSEEKEIRLLIEDVKPKKWDLPSTGVITPYIECGLFESAKDAEPFPLKLERIILGPNMKEQARNKHQIELMVQSMLYPVYLHVEPSKHNCYI